MKNPYKILVPIDFSECSQNAFEYAARMAQAFHAKILLMHVMEPVGGDATFFADTSMMSNQRKEAFEKLKLLDSKLPDIDPSLIEHEVSIGFPLQQIELAVKEHDIELIVMGTKGSSNRFWDMFGTHAWSLAKNAGCVVLTIPDGYKGETISNIAMAVELDAHENEYFLKIIRHLAYHFKANLQLVHVIKGDIASITGHEKSKAISWLLEQLSDFEVSFINLPSKNIGEALNEYVKDNRIDMIAVTPHKYNIFENMLHKSISKDLVLHSPIPIISLPGDYQEIKEE